MAFLEVFPLLFKLGVMPGILLATVDDSGHGSDIKSLNIPVTSVTNGIVLEMHRFMNMNSTCTYHTFWQWLASLLGDNWPQTDFPTVKAVRQSVVRLSYKFNKLKKMPCSEIKDATLSSFWMSRIVCPDSLDPMTNLSHCHHHPQAQLVPVVLKLKL